MRLKTGLFGLAFAALALVLSGCAAIQPPVQKTEPPQADSAYVAGKFTRKNSGGFAFVLVNTESKEEYEFSLGEDSTLPTDVTDQVIIVKVPPGKYLVSHWYTYSTLTKERSAKRPIRNPLLSAPFDAKARSVVFLGTYSAETTRTGNMVNWSIRPIPGSTVQARASLRQAYPLFSDLEFRCHVCLN